MLFTTVDVETTGLDPYNNDIIQCAYAITNEFGRVIRSECLYFYYPGVERSWTDGAYKVHGIPLAELRQHAEEFEVNCKKMWIAVARANIVGYNSDNFDVPFIKRWLKRMGYPMPEPYMSYDVMRILRSRGVKGKLVDVVDKIGFSTDIIESITKQNFGDTGRAHLAFYDVTATNLCFNYAINKKWVNLNPVTAEQVSKDRAERQLDEMDGRTLFNDMKYYITDANDNTFEVALCPDPNKYVYYKQLVTDKVGQFKESSEEPGVYRLGLICIKDNGSTITLEPYKEA